MKSMSIKHMARHTSTATPPPNTAGSFGLEILVDFDN